MSRVPIPVIPNRTPDQESERRLLEIRKEAETRGMVSGKGILPEGAPFPRATPQTGYYGIPTAERTAVDLGGPTLLFRGRRGGSSFHYCHCCPPA